MKEEIPHMQDQGGGAIVNTASIAGLIGLVTSSAYVAAKHGVIGLTKTAALEYADANIRVNAVCPGFIKTQMTADTMRRRGEAIIAQIPFRRMGEPGEIAAAYDVPAIGLKCDVSQAAEVDRTVTQIAERLGSLDILVNNAGITRDNLIHKMSDEDWDLVTAVHLRGAFLCSRAAQREMVKRNWGRIINLSSVSALGNRGQTNYSTAKAGLQGMARTLAIELGRYGVTANAIAPGFIDTEMTRATAIRLGRDPEEWKEERAKEIPVRRAGVPRDIANLGAFLCSDEASFISGQVIYVAGGPRS